MSVTRNLVTANFNVLNAKHFVYTVASDLNQYYIYAGRHIPYPGSDSSIPLPNNSVQQTHIDPYDNMIFAKRIQDTDVAHVIPKYLWTSNTVYQAYDHRDGDLASKMFYTVVDDTSEYNVYKCIYNNGGANSTIAPSRVGSPADLNTFITGDGYYWKYMYTITKTQYEKFASSSYVPVTANTDVIEGAVPGSIEVIKVADGGSRYSNYIANGVFKSGDILIDGVSTIYGAPETATAIDNYYQGCVLKITSGTGIDQYKKITSYIGTGLQKKFILDSGFDIVPQVNDTYEVYPYIYVWGDGSESEPAEARAIIDSASSNSISEVEMLNVGRGYRYALGYPGETPSTLPVSINSIYIQLPTVITQDINFREATLEPILSPKDGHGSDPWNELGANRICISVKFLNSESGTIPTQNDFRQVGIIKDPLFSNVSLLLDTANTVGSFGIGEKVHQVRQYKIAGNVTMSNTSTTLTKVDQGKISTTISILNGGTGYNSTANNQLVFNNTSTGGAGAAGTFTNNVSGVITSITITNQGSGYNLAPTVTIAAGAGGSNGVLSAALANPLITTFKDSYEVGDYILVQSSSNNFLTTVAAIPYDYEITMAANGGFTSNNVITSALVIEATGYVSSVSTGQIGLANVTGSFTETSKVIGITTGTLSTIKTSTIPAPAITLNDKSTTFNTAVQLYRLVGDYATGGTPFIEDEFISQNSLIAYAKPRGYLHHVEINGGAGDDVMYISNKFGVYNLDPLGVRTIVGNTSGATLDNISNKYPGDFVVGSGEVIYFENLDPVTRSDNKSEINKIILEF